MNSSQLLSQYKKSHFTDIDKQYLTNKDLINILNDLNFQKELLGNSEEGRPIFKLRIGKGSTKILIWTQMHGNESTGTRAVLDLLNFIKEAENKLVLDNLTIDIVLMLNPDGAERFTRLDSLGIDMNRDFNDRKSKEINLIVNLVTNVNYDYLINMHDQRSIFSAGVNGEAACLSFLAPSFNSLREDNPVRLKTKEIIGYTYSKLQEILPNNIGKYTDEFYPNATGDNFTKLGYPCILIESGFLPPDYERNNSRMFTFITLCHILDYLNSKDIEHRINEEYVQLYEKIPLNYKGFYDLILRSVKLNNESKTKDLAMNYTFKVVNNKLVKELVYMELQDSISRKGHEEYKIGEGYNCKLTNPYKKEEIVNLRIENCLEINKGILKWI